METPLHELARRQHGVITAAQAETAGFDRWTLRTLVRTEHWHRVTRGVYLLPGYDDSLLTTAYAHQLLNPALVASHRTAGIARGIEGIRPALEFTVLSGSHYAIQGGRAFRSKLSDAEVTNIGGLRVTDPVRTLCDLSRSLTRDDAVVALDAALRQGIAPPDDVAQAIESLVGRGSRAAREALSLADAGAGSPPETLARLRLIDAGFQPRVQVKVVDEFGRVAYVDLEVEGVLIEIEGRAAHASAEQHHADVWRFNDLTRYAGSPVLRFTSDDVYRRPRTFVRVVAATVAAHRERSVVVASPAVRVSS